MFARKKTVSTKSIYKYLRYSSRKTIVFMTSICKYLRYFESILQLQRCLRGFVLEWQGKAYLLQMKVPEFQHSAATTRASADCLRIQNVLEFKVSQKY